MAVKPLLMTNLDYPVSEQQRTQFDRDGVLYLRQVFDDARVAQMRSAVDRVMALPGGFWFKIYLWREDLDFRACCFDSPLPGIAAQLLQADKLNLLYDQLFVKPPSGKPTPWHNDLPYWPVQGTSVVSIWLALSPVGADNGALEFIRGSHRWNRRFQPFTTDPDGANYASHPDHNPDNEEMPDFSAQRDRYDLVSEPMAPGDVVVFHALTVHTARANVTSAQSRIGYAMRFMGGDCRYRLAPALNEYVLNSELHPGDCMDSAQYPVVYGGESTGPGSG